MIVDIPTKRKEDLNRWQSWSIALGSATSVICVLAAIFYSESFFRAYLAAYLFYLGIAHGCFAALMLYYLTGGAWGFLIRNILEAAMRTLPLMALLFIPIALGVYYLYPWTDQELIGASKELQHKQIYLNVPFFLVRALVYFILWLAVAFFLSRWSKAEERSGDLLYARRLTKMSGPGLVVFGITIFFASVDWIMSLQPAFRSTIIAPLFASGELLTGFACALAVFSWLISGPSSVQGISEDAIRDLGSLLFTFLIMWAYMAYFQFMLIWIANLQYDVQWYVPRSISSWKWIAWALVIFHFVLPFFLLLSRKIKENPRLLAYLAGLILFMHIIYLYFLILPAFPYWAWADPLFHGLVMIAVGSLWLANFFWNIKRYPLFPTHDGNRDAAYRTKAHHHESQLRGEEVGNA